MSQSPFHLGQSASGFSLFLDGKLLLKHSADAPCLWLGHGNADIKMYRGNFHIKDYVEERIALDAFKITEVSGGFDITLSRGKDEACLAIRETEGRLNIKLKAGRAETNRLWLRLEAEADEKVYGCGEQYSHFNLRGKNFPLWTSEQGVGRNKKTHVTWQADCLEGAGGDYYWTYFPQPTFVSSRRYYCHLAESCYMDFDFRNPAFHELQIWADEANLTFEVAPSFIDLLEKLTGLLGRQPELPDWVNDGIMLGVQGGPDVIQKKLDTMRNAGVPVVGMWVQDWEGIRNTSFGQRLMWNWQWDPERYPDLPAHMKRWKAEGVRFLGYINTYVATEKNLYAEAAEKGLLVKTLDGKNYDVECGEFHAGIPDLTNPAGFEWYKNVIKKNMIAFGLDGWMADFGEYLPMDCKLHSGISPEVAHNLWPALWAQCNYEALVETGTLGKLFFFMRAGYTGSQKHCIAMWAGDQNVDWSLDDGLASVIPAALSLAMTGHGLHHSDIGGFTTLFEMKRTKELLLRWTEFAAFTTAMRSHEGNRPKTNWQFDHDGETIDLFAKMGKVFAALAPYRKELMKANTAKGLPVMRPMFLHYESDPACYELQYQYMLGEDMLVAPVYEEGKEDRTLYLPAGEWVHLWTGKTVSSKGHDITVEAPIGQPPVFWRSDSKWSDLFRKAGAIRAR